MATLLLLLVLPLVVCGSVIKITLNKPDAFDKNLEELRSKTYLYCAEGFLMRCSTFFDEHNKDTAIPYQLAEERVTVTSVAVIYKHSPCSVYETPPQHQERAYMFLDSCEGGMTQIDVGDEEAEAWISPGKWYYCNNEGCRDSDTQRIASTTWTVPSFI